MVASRWRWALGPGAARGKDGMASTVALSMTKWSMDVGTKFIKADTRLHNAALIKDDMAIIFVVNHFTRIETLLLPYILHKHTGREVWSLAAGELFKGRVGDFLRSTGTVSTTDPDRDKIIIKTLLNGAHPWVIFPEGAMIKDKKVIDHQGEFEIYSERGRRAPHTGAAVLALRTEFYRHKISCLRDRPGQEGLAEALAKFDLSNGDDALKKRTVIVPVNITYFPLRARENIFVALARALSTDLSKRAVEELSVEGTVISKGTDIDITLGEPIDVLEYLQAPEFAEMMACGMNDMQDLESDPGSIFNDAARRLMLRYMSDIYQLTTVNYDHLFATLLRCQPDPIFTERSLRNRVFLTAHMLVQENQYRLHDLLRTTYRDMVFEDPCKKFNDFISICVKEGVLKREGNHFVRQVRPRQGQVGFHEARWEEMTEVIANEAEPLRRFQTIAQDVAQMPRFILSKRIRDIFVEEDRRIFEEDYARFYSVQYSKGLDVGRPFLLKPMHPKSGIVLCHGYMAAPLEVRALADYLYQQGHAVYGVRMRGHGTAPEDLAQCRWEEWYESFNRGYAIVKTLSDDIILGGFSTGGCMAMMAAARKGVKVQGVFSICAPLQLRSYSARWAPSVVSLNSLLKRMGRKSEGFEYVENHSENPHINYARNPLAGVGQLMGVMSAMEGSLKDIHVPALVVQGSKDHTVNPASAQTIYEGIGSEYKELLYFERTRHGIVNGRGSQDVFACVNHFLQRAPRHVTMETLDLSDEPQAVAG